MTLSRVLLALTLAFPFTAAQAQNSATPPAPVPAAKAYRLVWTLDESEAGKRVSTQHYEMIVTTNGRTTAKLGSKVPVVTGSYSGSAPAGVQTQFQYIDVGLNLDASLDETSSGLRLRSKVEQSSVADDKTTNGSGVEFHEPIIRQAVMEGTSLLTLGKTITLGSLDVPASTHHLDISVTLEQVK